MKKEYKQFVCAVLNDIGLFSENAVYLLLGTRAQESLFGQYNKQVNGPALGTYQMEPSTFYDIVKNVLSYKSKLSNKIKFVCNVSEFKAEDLIKNEKLAICFARLQYYRRPEPLPNRFDIVEMAEYWKAHYNTNLGKGKPAEFVDKFHRLGLYTLLKSE